MKMIDDDFNESEMFGDGAGIKPKQSDPLSSGNPLSSYFRLPGLSVPLPTGGRYFPKGGIELDAMGQVSVYPMRGADEMLLKAPDALMSGLAVERLIESCVPAIKQPNMVSSPDLDVLLLAIRAATFGNTMSVEVQCPNCEHEMAFDCDLQGVLATLKPLPEDLDIRLSPEMVIVMRPHTLASQTKLLLAAYDEQRKAMRMDELENDEARQTMLRGTLAKITQFQNTSIADAIEKICIPGNEVRNRDHILEFVVNAPREQSDAMRKRVEEINAMGIDRDLEVACEKCQHGWTTKIEFNPSTFFAQSSSA